MIRMERFMDYCIDFDRNIPALRFAAAELTRALELLRAPDMQIRLRADNDEYDGFTVDMNFPGGKGFIKGSNPRSVLFGVYRLMRGLGFRWVRPGKSGEIVPAVPETWQYMRFWEQASAKLRAICVEGAVSRENLLDTVDWMAKNFFNTYYIQADSVYAFMERWYTHPGNPLLAPEPLTREKAAAVTGEIIAALKQRGMILQQFGHGPTCEILGLSHWGWDPELQPVTAEMKTAFAEINGIRDLWHNTPKYTQLCYGNPEIQERLADRMVELITGNPDAELVNFFLSDHHHNFCECQLCRTARPADWYVKILNRIDEKLSAIGNRTRIGFAVYYDLLWPPVKEKLRNPERFFLVACPVTRSYSSSLYDQTPAEKIPHYLQNISPYPADNGRNLAFYRAWQKVFTGECVVFDYHYMWDLHKDPSGYALPRVIHQDAVSLADSGMSGFISCQNQRAFYPNSLGMTALGAGLWDETSQFDEVAADYFRSAFGGSWQAAQHYFLEVEKFFPVRGVRGEMTGTECAEAAEVLVSELPQKIISQVMPAVQQGLSAENPVHRQSWQILKLHTEHLLLLCRAFAAVWQHSSRAGKAVAELFDWARRHETVLQPIWDVYEYLSVSITATGVDRGRFMNSLNAAETDGDLAEV